MSEHDTERPPDDAYDPDQESTDVAQPVNVITSVQENGRVHSAVIDGHILHNVELVAVASDGGLLVKLTKYKLFATVLRG